MDKLRPCPFCGGSALLEVNRFGERSNDFAKAYCKSCAATITRRIDVEYYAKDLVIEAWNKRKGDDEK